MSSILKTYNRKKISFNRGKGSFLYDTKGKKYLDFVQGIACLLYTSPSPRDRTRSRMPSSA